MNDTTTPNAPSTPYPEIAAIGAQLRASVANDNPHASTDMTLGAQQVTLSRTGIRWALTITDAAAVQPHTADLWATAVGAPTVDWWRTQQGRRWRADWTEPTT